MRSRKAFCDECGTVLDGAVRFSDATKRMEELGKTYARLPRHKHLCEECSWEMVWIGAALLDAKYGTAALSLERMEDLGLTERAAWRRAHGGPGGGARGFPPLDQAA